MKAFLRTNKEWILTWSAIIIIIIVAVRFWPQPTAPVPSDIKAQIHFRIVWPKEYHIVPSSWTYLKDQGTLSFVTQNNGPTIVFTESEVPLAYQNDIAAYDRFVGTLRPLATFNTKLGPISIVNFVTAGDYQVEGASAILNTKGTLIFMHPTAMLTEDQWRSLFDALAV